MGSILAILLAKLLDPIAIAVVCITAYRSDKKVYWLLAWSLAFVVSEVLMYFADPIREFEDSALSLAASIPAFIILTAAARWFKARRKVGNQKSS
jgi:hypothetical protein